MAGHYACIGVAGGEEEVFAFLNVAVEGGAARDRADGGREILWRDPSGASVAVDTAPDGEILCARPSFLGSSRLNVLVNGIGEDPECRFCSRLFVDVLEEGETVYPLAVELEEIDAVMEAVPKDERRALRVTAFAESIETWTDEAAYHEAVSQEEAPLAARSLIPVGFFTPPARHRLLRRRVEEVPPTAEALLTGVVASFRELRNETTGNPFICAELDTFGGRYDAVVAAEEAEGSRSAPSCNSRAG